METIGESYCHKERHLKPFSKHPHPEFEPLKPKAYLEAAPNPVSSGYLLIHVTISIHHKRNIPKRSYGIRYDPPCKAKP